MNKCYFCSGTVSPKRVTHVHQWRGQTIIFEDVPADVCEQCGEVYFPPDVLMAMDKVAEVNQQTGPDKQVPVLAYSLSELKMGKSPFAEYRGFLKELEGSDPDQIIRELRGN